MAYGFRGEKRSGKMMNTHIKFLKINKILSKNLFSLTTYTKIKKKTLNICFSVQPNINIHWSEVVALQLSYENFVAM